MLLQSFYTIVMISWCQQRLDFHPNPYHAEHFFVELSLRTWTAGWSNDKIRSPLLPFHWCCSLYANRWFSFRPNPPCAGHTVPQSNAETWISSRRSNVFLYQCAGKMMLLARFSWLIFRITFISNAVFLWAKFVIEDWIIWHYFLLGTFLTLFSGVLFCLCYMDIM